MASNMEIKAKVADLNQLVARAEALAGTPVQCVEQDDTFFNCEKGRLKLRAFPAQPGRGELIFYQRADQQGPKPSFYEIAATTCVDDLRKTLSLAYGEAGRVRKTRRFVLLGHTRVHLDQVHGLGDFMELEVVVDGAQSEAAAFQEAQELMQALGLQDAPQIATAYVDLLRAQGQA